MKNTNLIIGAVAVGLVGLYLYNKNKQTSTTTTPQPNVGFANATGVSKIIPAKGAPWCGGCPKGSQCVYVYFSDGTAGWRCYDASLDKIVASK